MKLKVKDMDIATGGVIVVVLNKEDARKMDLHALDRIKICYKHKCAVAVVDIAESNKSVPEGHIGFFEEVIKKIGIRRGTVEISFAEKPSSIDYIRKKLEGETLNKEEIKTIISDIANDTLSVSELTYFVSAVYTKKFSMKEISDLTIATASFGDTLEFHGRIFDKHCVGGVPNNRTTMIVVPIMASLGLRMPKTSSRSITSPSGTADTMEVLAPVSISVSKMKRIVRTIGGCIVWGGSMNIAAADDKLIKVRNYMRLDPEALLLSSILAKKKAVGSTDVLIDIPVGNETKIKNKSKAKYLKKKFIKIGKLLGMNVNVLITKGNEPIGNGIGPALEARDVLWVLKNDKKGPLDLKEKALYLATKILEMAGKKNAYDKAKHILESGLAYKKMNEIIKAQGGTPIAPEKIFLGKHVYEVRSERTGRVKNIQIKTISKIARLAGAPTDAGAGIYLHKHEKEKVMKGDILYELYSVNKEKFNFAKKFIREDNAYEID